MTNADTPTTAPVPAGPGTVLLTGPTRGLGRAAVRAMASRPAAERPDLILVGRTGSALDDTAAEARAHGAVVHTVGCDLADLADVRAAAAAARELLRSGTVRPLHALVANAGLMSPDTRRASADGYELTFAVNYLAHAQLIGDLLDAFAAPARIVLLGSNTYAANLGRKLLHVPPARWADPVELARPATGPKPPMSESGTAYSNAKLAVLYYAHELQRHTPEGVNVAVYEPGWMPGTSLGRDAPRIFQALGRALARIPGVATPETSGPALASVALDPRWSHLRDGAFVVRDTLTTPRPPAHDPACESHLWTTTAHLLAASVDLA